MILPELVADSMWQVHYDNDTVSLLVTVAGDYNADGIVGIADYTLWRDTLGQAVSQLTGADGNGNGVVDAADYRVWKSNFGQQTSAAIASSNTVVPEPKSIALGILTLLMILYRAA